MNKHPREVTDAALRDLDTAPNIDLSVAERERADAIFARIVGTPADGPVPVEPQRARRSRKLLLVPAGLLGAGIAVPMLLLGGSAFGSWTETPEPLTGKAAIKAGDTCLANNPMTDEGARVVIADRRGDWTYVLLAGPNSEGSCLFPYDLEGPRDLARDEEWALGTFRPSRPGEAPTPAPDRIVETHALGSSVPVPDPWPFHTGEGWVNWVEGYLGSDVTGVTVHTSSGLEIEASINGNRFAAWWPSEGQSSDNPDDSWSYTVHLADGSSRDTDG